MDLEEIRPPSEFRYQDHLAETLTVGVHFVFLGAITFVTAAPFLFPSLGPSAYLLAVGEGVSPSESGPYHVIGGHLVATIAGLIGYHLLASGFHVTNALTLPMFSEPTLHLAASSVVAMMLTTFGMLVTDTNHPAACATTLLVSLGLLSTFIEATYIMIAVVVLVAAHELAIYPGMVKLGLDPANPRRE